MTVVQSLSSEAGTTRTNRGKQGTTDSIHTITFASVHANMWSSLSDNWTCVLDPSVGKTGDQNRQLILTLAGQLPSKNIIHVFLSSGSAKIKEVVYSVLELCEENKFSSVTFPALGTGLCRQPQSCREELDWQTNVHRCWYSYALLPLYGSQVKVEQIPLQRRMPCWTPWLTLWGKNNQSLFAA